MAEKLQFDTSEANNLDAAILEADQSAAKPDHVKSNHLYKDTTSREIQIGTMPIIPPEKVMIEPITGEITSKNVFIIPEGYHDGTGKVYTGKLSDYTPGNANPEDVANNKIYWVNGKKCVGTLNVQQNEQIATATSDDIVEGKTAWVRGNKITGTIPKLPRRDKTLLSEESYTIPYGLSVGTTVITAASISSQTPGNAKSDDIISGKTAWVKGEKIIGSLIMRDKIKEELKDTDTYQDNVLFGKKFYSSVYGNIVSGRMVNHSGEPAREIKIGQEFYIPKGYYDGNNRITTQSLHDATIGSAKSNQIINGETAWVNGEKVTGTMPIIPSKAVDVEAGITYIIPEGFHTGVGQIRTKSVKELTPGTARDYEIVSGKVAWVNGNKTIGTMPEHKDYSIEIDPGQTYFVPKGYHTGSGSISVKTMEKLTPSTAKESDILSGKTAWSNGKKITGNIPINKPVKISMSAGESYNVPVGFHKDPSVIQAKPLNVQTQGTADATDILFGKIAWVNGKKITGTTSLTGNADPTDVLLGKTFYNTNAKKSLTGTLDLDGNANEDCVLEGYTFYNSNPKRKLTGSLKLSGTASSSNVLEGSTFYSNNPKNKQSGSMPNIGSFNKKINLNETINIPKGYHDGTGQIISGSLASQTPGTADSTDILLNQTAWVNGNKVTGSLELTGDATPEKVADGITFYSRNAKFKQTGTMKSITGKHISLNCGQEYVIDPGYHDGTSRITANSLASQTKGNAISENILSSKIAWVNGDKIIGTMPDRSSTGWKNIPAGETLSIPKGYYDGTGSFNTLPLNDQTTGDATDGDILKDKISWVNGKKVVGTIPTRETKQIRINAGNDITIPAGYYPHGVTIYSLFIDRLDLTGTDAEVIDTVFYPNSTGHVDGDNLVVTVNNIT